MPSEYSTSSGGALKLKGGAITKPKKKKKAKVTDGQASQATASSTTAPPSTTPTTETNPASLLTTETPDTHTEADANPLSPPPRSISPSEAQRDLVANGGRVKTEAEKRYEERRRKRLDERLKREGVKTHKERVEELNRYLSGLSEHHDMPKIGPG